jgi:hypothetical protein
MSWSSDLRWNISCWRGSAFYATLDFVISTFPPHFCGGTAPCWPPHPMPEGIGDDRIPLSLTMMKQKCHIIGSVTICWSAVPSKVAWAAKCHRLPSILNRERHFRESRECQDPSTIFHHGPRASCCTLDLRGLGSAVGWASFLSSGKISTLGFSFPP